MIKKPGLLDRLKAGIQKTRAGLMEKIEDAISGRKEIDAELLEELEYALITADIGARTTAEVLERIRQRVERHLVSDAVEIKTQLKQHLLEILESVLIPLPPLKEISRIVSKVDELMALCDQLKSRITEANQLQQKLADVVVEKAVA